LLELVKSRPDDIAKGVTTITINRPDSMNALNEAVADQFAGIFRHATTEGVQDGATAGVVIAGAGRSFVAGADIKFFIRNIERHNVADIEKLTRSLQQLLLEIQNCRKPVVARVHGLALGGGVELALACDYIVATPNASFGFPETGIGIYPGLGGTQRTTRRIGVGLTKWLVFTGELIGADEALAIGLIDAVASRDDLDAAIATLVARGKSKERRPLSPPPAYRKIADFFEQNDVESIRTGRADTHGDQRLEKARKAVGTKAPIALRIAAALIDEGIRVPLEQGLQTELSHLHEIFSTRDALAGLLSIGKTRPIFEGA
jgi:enoyl-CoA hydratase/3-hydroxyacyl-CoA dehydrogenase